MERLTFVTEDGEVLFHPEDLPDDEGMTITQLAEERRFDALEIIAERLANREQADEQGLLLRLPCKVGDTVYKPNPITKKGIVEIKIESIFITESGISISGSTTIKKYLFCCQPDDFGKTVFLTEAEAKLAEMEGAE